MNDITIAKRQNSQKGFFDGIFIRQFIETDFALIQALYKREGWMTFINKSEDGLEAWKNSDITLVAVKGDVIVGFVRALTDEKITTYIAEIIVDVNYRGKGLGRTLIDACHAVYPSTRIDLLSTEGADSFYKKDNFKEITGFRKSYY